MSRHPGCIFKTIRSDENDFWEKFVAELVEPEKEENRFEKRMEGERYPYTNRLNSETKKYEVVETEFALKKSAKEKNTKHVRSNSLYSPEKKISVTKHQSASYANPAAGYKPFFFGWNKNNRNELLVGVVLDPNDCLFWSMMLYDGGTYGRTKDFRTREGAQAFLDKKIKDGILHESLANLEEAGKKNPQKFNEVLAGLKWNLDNTVYPAKIAVFTDNLESRLLAQLRALDLQKRLEKKYPDRKPIAVPISIYPDINDASKTDFTLYADEMQKQDSSALENNSRLAHYAEAIRFVQSAEITDSKSLNHLMQTRALLEKLGKKYADDYYSFEKNKFYLSMQALYEASNKLAENVAKIADDALDLIETSSSRELIKALSVSAVIGVNTGLNGFYFLMYALNNSVVRNKGLYENLAKTVDVALRLIRKISRSELSELIKVLSVGEIVAKSNFNGFYFLMYALANAAAVDKIDYVTRITDVVSLLIEKSDSAELIKALSISAVEAVHAGWNGFYALMRALNYAAMKNSSENVAKIADIVLNLINRATPAELNKLIDGPSAKDNAGWSGFYVLMYALNYAAMKNSSENVAKIIDLMEMLIRKTGFDHLIEGLCKSSEKMDNYFSLLMSAFLWSALKKSSKNIAKIAEFALYLIEKGNPKDLIQGLSASVSALEVFSEDVEKIVDVVLKILEKLSNQPPSKKLKDRILKQKNKLQAPLKKHLSSMQDADTLKTVSASNTILGALIDHDRNLVYGFFKKKGMKTATRKLVDARLAEIAKDNQIAFAYITGSCNCSA